MESIIAALTGFIIALIDASGYLGIFLLMTAESALIPIPSEVTMPFAGFVASLGHLNFWAVVFVGAIANLFGSLLAYILGYWGEDAFIRNLIKRYGRFFLITMDEYDRAERWFRKYGQPVVFFSRMMPIVRTFISLPAGVAKMNIYKFSYLTLIGSFLWSLLLTYIGFTLGQNWKSIEGIYRKFEYVIVVIIIAAAAWYIWHKVKKLHRR